jgi:hypothetical protein
MPSGSRGRVTALSVTRRRSRVAAEPCSAPATSILRASPTSPVRGYRGEPPTAAVGLGGVADEVLLRASQAVTVWHGVTLRVTKQDARMRHVRSGFSINSARSVTLQPVNSVLVALAERLRRRLRTR